MCEILPKITTTLPLIECEHCRRLHLFVTRTYRVTVVVEYLGWVDLDLGSSPGWWAASVASYCQSRLVEHPKSKSTQPRYSTTTVTL